MKEIQEKSKVIILEEGVVSVEEPSFCIGFCIGFVGVGIK